MIKFDKHIWEGWTVLDFINSLDYLIEKSINGNSSLKKITTKEELKKFCRENRPYYKKHIPEVYNYFEEKYNDKLI